MVSIKNIAKKRLKTVSKKKIDSSNEPYEELIYKDTMYAADSASSAVKNSINNNFIIPFASALGSPSEFIALISSVPFLIGSFFQLFSMDLLNIIKKRKLIIAVTAFIDAILWLPILLIPYVWSNNYFLLLNLLIIQAIALSILRPIYNSLLGDVVPQSKRGVVFAKINRISGTVSFASTIAFGFILKKLDTNPFLGFSIVFGFAMVSRLVSASIKLSYKDPKKFEKIVNPSFFHFTKTLKTTNFGKFSLFSSMFNLAVSMTSPFFPIYMLTVLKLDYFMYTIVSAASIISSLIVIQKLGRRIDAEGSKIMLEISSFLIPVVPVLWMFFINPIHLIILQLISGAAWAGFNLATSNFLIDATTDKNRVSNNSYFHFMNGAFSFVGAMIGGYIVKFLLPLKGPQTYLILFGLSGLLRWVFAFYFIPKLEEEKFINVKLKGSKDKRIISIRPQRGIEYVDIPHKHTEMKKVQK